jgi:glucosamine-phosphate N-acetyltransferase
MSDITISIMTLFDLIELNQDKIEQIKERYLLLLSNLTVTGYIETALFIKNINKISEMGSIIVAFVTEPTGDIDMIASGTIIIEPKIIRQGKNVGHIEDIVVAPHMRGRGLSHKILNHLKQFAKESNCYKVILDCSEEVKNVYTKNNLKVKGLHMSEYF